MFYTFFFFSSDILPPSENLELKHCLHFFVDFVLGTNLERSNDISVMGKYFAAVFCI